MVENYGKLNFGEEIEKGISARDPNDEES